MTNNAPHLSIEKTYIKSISFKSPNSPQIFRQDNKAKTKIEIGVRHEKIEKNVYEVVLGVNINTLINNKTIFFLDVKQAGLFNLRNFLVSKVDEVLETYCADILLPYAREEMSSITVKGGLSPFLLDPINFNELYQQKILANNATRH